jgi:hypothetical protein
VDGGWPDGAFPAAGVAAQPDDARAKLWDDLWAAHESARCRLHPIRAGFRLKRQIGM